MPLIQEVLDGHWKSEAHGKDVLEAFSYIAKRIRQTEAAMRRSSDRRAIITWSEARVQAGLWSTTERTVPAWFGTPNSGEGWSLCCAFDPPAKVQGNPSVAEVHFVRPNAPHERLVPGAVLFLHEDLAGSYGRVDVVEWPSVT